MAESLLIEEASPFVEDMVSSVIVEPSPADAVGGTLPAAAIQFADLTESGSESGDEPNEGQQQQQQQQDTSSSGAGPNTTAARSSPPPNCAICLSRCRRKCFTDSCMHQFCFKCLCEWSKIKPECPLCKQPFKTIIHNVRTLDDYDRYPVQSSSPEHSALSFHIVNIRRQHLMRQNQAVMTNDDGDDIDAAASDDSQDGTSNAQPSRIHAPYNRFEPYRMELLDFYRNDQDARGTGSLSMLWRRYVYDRKLYALPVSDSLTGHFREWSARFYRDNPAQMHRLMPWINRDIVCLLRTSPQNVSQVMHMMNDILPMINIPTRTFRRRLSPFLGERTNHFIHELFNFARSPYDMIGYDRVVQYSALVAEEVEVDLLDLVSTNDGSSPREPDASANASGNANGESNGNGSGTANANGDPGTEWSRMPRPSTSVIVTNPSATHSFSVTMATDGSELPGISIRRTTTSNVGSQTVAINLSMRRPANEVIEIDDGDAAANAEVAAINDSNNQTGRRQAGASLPISAHIELQSSDCSNSSDDDDECVFVLERKPPHLRTPELVSLDSNSDSDVVFVDEQKPSTPLKAADVDSGSVEQEIESGVSPLGNELFLGPSTSTGVCSTSGKNWKMVLEEARRQDLMRMQSGRPKRNLTRAQHRSMPTAPSSSSTSDATLWTNSTDSSSNSEDSKVVATRRKRRAARKSKTRKRAANVKPPAPFKIKRRRRLASEAEEDEPQEERMESSSDSSSSSSSSTDESSEEEVAGDSSNNNPLKDSSSSTSDEDSTENLILSTLRDTLKAEEDRKPPKRELDADAGGEETLQQQPQHEQEEEEEVEQSSTTKRRRSCNSSSNLSSRSHSNSVNSTLASHNTTMSSCSALSLFNSNRDESVPTTRPSLLELSTLSVGGGSGLFNEQSQGVEDAISYLRNAHTHDDDAQLGIYSDASNELQNYPTEAADELAIDVVGEANSSAHGESVDANEDNDNDNDDEQDEQEQDEENDEDYDEEDNDAEEDDAAAVATADSDATESDLDATDAY